ncbi:putative RNA-binding protein Luc7-like 2 [Anneissia japonica]|uniref:putative RNA-binding protein Luc7-like 2 n=2 Tax=Anneissia japonica TaxID=1529436 RepID=UPI001425A8C1|nr:putative RNA-binding protein Luc7-like 2 [Anneissia japonica]
MSAQEQMRKMLDELMGTSRNGEVGKDRVRFEDPKVCRSFLLNCCPHDILSSTRMDLGDCSKVHDLALRADYEAASKDKDYGYDIDAMEHLSSFIADCDRRTDLAKKRLAETQEELGAEINSKADKVHELAESIGKKVMEAEKLGAEGNVEESMKMMQEVEEIRKKKSEAEEEYRQSMPASTYQQQKLRVCEVCSAYLGLQDNDRRLADHFGGKLHLGFIEIREKLAALKKLVAAKKESREAERAKRREEREKERDKELQHRKRRSRSRSRRSRSRDRRRRSKSREKSRRSRERHRRSRSRSRDRRRRSRSRERASRRRSRSRSYERRSRSRDKRSCDRRSREKSSRRSNDREDRNGDRRSVSVD